MATLYYSTRPVIVNDESIIISENTVTKIDSNNTQTDLTQQQAQAYTCSGTFKIIRIVNRKKPKHWRFVEQYHTKHSQLRTSSPRTNYWNRIRGQLAIVHKYSHIFNLIILIIFS